MLRKSVGWARLNYRWLLFGAVLWIVALFLGLPAIDVSQQPTGTFLWLKLLTTGVSISVAIILVSIPKRSWLFVTVPAIIFLGLVEYMAWVRFP